MDILYPILQYFKDEKVKITTKEICKNIIKNVAFKIKNVNWIQNLLYQFLQFITIENADI